MAAHLRSAASFSAALATLNAAAADAEACGRADLLLRVQGLRGNVLARLGQPREGIAAVREALDQALAQSLPDTAAELQQRLADALEHSGDYRAATAAYAAAYQYCDAHGADAVGQLCRACASAVLFARGEWDRTAGVCQDVLASAAAPHARAVGAGLLGLVHAMRGTARLARPHLLDSHLTATRIELTAMELLSSWGLCVLDGRGRRSRRRRRPARQILARLARTQERHYSVPILPWLATFFAVQGLAADASACAAALAQIAEATAQPEAIAALAHARGETLLADQPEARPTSCVRRPRCSAAWTCRCRPRKPSAARPPRPPRLGERARARELLHAAHATADQLGARPLRESCAAELRQLGVKPRRPASSRRGDRGLTSRELDVMRLVAHGNTSRQIGSTLFISPRTVEMHVQQQPAEAAVGGGCRAGNRRAVWPVEASYSSTMLAGMRPRSLSSMPCCLAHARNVTAALTAGRGPRWPPLSSGHPVRVLDERRQPLAELPGVLGVQVDLVVRAVQPEAHRLLGRTAIKIIFYDDDFPAYHPRPP